MSIINTALIGKLKKTKANKDNVLELDNLTSFTPTSDFHPATKKYVDDAILVTSVNGETGNVTVQDVLVSGTNIKTINGTPILGSGDINIQGGSVSGTVYSASLTVPESPSPGEIWFNQETGQTFQYNNDADGTEFWLEIGSSAFTDSQYTLNESDLITVTDPLVKEYTFAHYTGFVQVFINRLKLRKTEFTSNDGTSITLNVDLDVGDEIEIVTLNVVQG